MKALLKMMGLLIWCYGSLSNAAEDCGQSANTLEHARCLSESLEAKEVTLQHYLSEVRSRYRDDKTVLDTIEEAQQQWLQYRHNQCQSIYTIWDMAQSVA